MLLFLAAHNLVLVSSCKTGSVADAVQVRAKLGYTKESADDNRRASQRNDYRNPDPTDRAFDCAGSATFPSAAGDLYGFSGIVVSVQ